MSALPTLSAKALLLRLYALTAALRAPSRQRSTLSEETKYLRTIVFILRHLSWRPRRSATFLYMSESVGVAELRQNLSVYLRRVSGGERLLVTDRNRPVAELGPAPSTGPDLDRLIAEGRVSRPRRSSLPAPLELTGDPRALSRALDDIRGDR